MRVAGGGVERPAGGQSLPVRVAPEGAAKAAGPSVTAGGSPNAEGAKARRKASRSQADPRQSRRSPVFPRRRNGPACSWKPQGVNLGDAPTYAPTPRDTDRSLRLPK